MIRCRAGRIGNESCFGLRFRPFRCVNISFPLRTCCLPNRITSRRLCPVKGGAPAQAAPLSLPGVFLELSNFIRSNVEIRSSRI